MPKRLVLPRPDLSLTGDPAIDVAKLLKYIKDLHRALEQIEFISKEDLP